MTFYPEDSLVKRSKDVTLIVVIFARLNGLTKEGENTAYTPPNSMGPFTSPYRDNILVMSPYLFLSTVTSFYCLRICRCSSFLSCTDTELQFAVVGCKRLTRLQWGLRLIVNCCIKILDIWQPSFGVAPTTEFSASCYIFTVSNSCLLFKPRSAISAVAELFVFLLWAWTSNYDLDLRTWHEPACQIRWSKSCSSKITEQTRAQTHTPRTSSSNWTTEVVDKKYTALLLSLCTVSCWTLTSLGMLLHIVLATKSRHASPCWHSNLLMMHDGVWTLLDTGHHTVIRWHPQSTSIFVASHELQCR